MRWLDVMGPTGVGKTTICNCLSVPEDIEWDGEPPPTEWKEFLRVSHDLHKKIVRGGTRGCIERMENAVNRIATVFRKPGDGCYINIGLAHRGLSLGWRLPKIEDVAEFFGMMPISEGVASLFCDLETLQQRNIQRGKTKPNKQRWELAQRMESVREFAVSVLKDRGVRVIEIDTTEAIEANEQRLIEFTR